MPQELAYVIITPYSLFKSRTGGIIARLIARTGLELAAARMFAPSLALLKDYAQTIVTAKEPRERFFQELIRDYVLERMSPDPKTGKPRRVMLLLFRGPDAIQKVHSVVGNIRPERLVGETIRDTYGDVILDEHGGVRYFEPAVLAASNPEEARLRLKLWARYSDTDGGVLEEVISYGPGEVPERTLVLIKPDNFRFPTGRPGNMIDFFSKTGLYIVGIKVHRMSVAQALEFYAPVRDVLRAKYTELMSSRAAEIIERTLEFKIPPAERQELGKILGPLAGQHQFESIVRFMSGRVPGECDEALLNAPGTEKCIALIYEGVDAVRKIRDVLGPTDPSQAPPGSIRREFGQTIMVNAAHASDSVASAQREMKIVNVGENLFKQIVQETYGSLD